MIHRHNRCVGFTLFKIGRKQVELWFCPKGEVIESHVHQKMDSKILFLWGKIDGTIGERTKRLDWRHVFRRFKIPSNVTHSAKVLGFCVFANIETWNVPNPSSAAIDFWA